MPSLSFDETAAETVIETFGWEVSDDPEDLVVDADGEPVEDFHGHYITIHQFAGVVADENGDPTPLRDSFPAIGDYVAHKRERGDRSVNHGDRPMTEQSTDDTDRPAIVEYDTGGYLDDQEDDPVQVDTARIDFSNGVRYIVESRDGLERTERAIIPGTDVERREKHQSGVSPETWVWGVVSEYFIIDYPDHLIDASRTFPQVFEEANQRGLHTETAQGGDST